MTNRNRILASLGVLALFCVFGASQAFAVNIGGKLFTLATPPVAVSGATVSVYSGGSGSAVTAGDGSWTITGLSGTSDPVLKIAATGTTVETYTTYPLTLLMTYQGTSSVQYDISAVRTVDYVGVPPGSCLILGFAVQFSDLVYPNAYTQVAGVVVTASGSPPALYFAYVKPDGSPCPPPLCNATTSIGGWIGVATPPTTLKYSGTLTVGGSCSAPPPLVFSGGDVTCVADTANITGLVHPTLP